MTTKAPDLSATPPPADTKGTRDEQHMFVLSGQVSTLYVTDGTVNLLKGMQSKMLATGMGAAVQGMAGSVANSAMIAMYDGEYVQHFGCYIGEQMVIGTFESIEFSDGDEIKVVATRLDDKVAFAHAVVRPSDGLLWMPHSINKGRWKVAEWIAKMLFGIAAGGLAFLCVLQIFIQAFESYVSLILVMGSGLLLTGGFIGGGAFWSSLDDAKYAERILKVLGFKNPKLVNLSPFSVASLQGDGSYQIYDLRKALKAYGSLSKAAPERTGRP